MAVEYITMTARKRSRCNRCGEMIEPGHRILWDAHARMAEHKECSDVGDFDDTIEPLRWDGQ